MFNTSFHFSSFYKDYLLTYSTKYKQYGNDLIVIKKASLDKFIKTRANSNSAYTITVKAIAAIEVMYFISNWTKGADDNVYMITKDLHRNTAAYMFKNNYLNNNN